MKCKAKWHNRLGLWVVKCRECDMAMWHAYANDAIVKLPHDIAVNHARRYHTKEG